MSERIGPTAWPITPAVAWRGAGGARLCASRPPRPLAAAGARSREELPPRREAPTLRNPHLSDRIRIENTSALDLDLASFALRKENDAPANAGGVVEVTSPSQEEYKKQLRSQLLDEPAAGCAAAGAARGPKILAFKSKVHERASLC